MLETIRTRRSIRAYTGEPVDDGLVDEVLEAGTWAPSGLNNQPWKFLVVREASLRSRMAAQTRYGKIVEGAPVCVAVFLDRGESYNRIKDIQAIGACIQNMLLAAHHLGLGAVWLGEILNRREDVERILEVPEGCELMAVIALGRPAKPGGRGSRKPLDQVVLDRR